MVYLGFTLAGGFTPLLGRGFFVVQVISKQQARKYRKEVRTQRASGGSGGPLDAPEVVRKLVRLRLRNGTLNETSRLKDKEVLDKLEKALPQHITAEADRVITTVTQEVRGVGNAVAALQMDLTPVIALARGEVTLDDSMSLEQQKVATDLQQAVLIARKRKIAAAMKEENVAAKAAAKKVVNEEKAAAKAAVKEEKVAGLAAAFARGRARA